MVDTFDVVAGDKATRYTNAKEAGAAYFEADSATRRRLYGVVGANRGRPARMFPDKTTLPANWHPQ